MESKPFESTFASDFPESKPLFSDSTPVNFSLFADESDDETDKPER